MLKKMCMKEEMLCSQGLYITLPEVLDESRIQIFSNVRSIEFYEHRYNITDWHIKFPNVSTFENVANSYVSLKVWIFNFSKSGVLEKRCFKILYPEFPNLERVEKYPIDVFLTFS
jgi:hypothetical protein